MRSLKFTLFIFFILIISSKLFGVGTQVVNDDYAIIEDSIVIQKYGLRNQFVIYTGDKIQVWLENNSTIKGQLLSFDGYVITIANGDLTLKVPIYKIEKIKRFGDKGAQIFGTAIVVLGVGVMVGSILGVAAGVILVASGTITSAAYPAFFLGAILYGGLGFAVYKGGDAIVGRRVNLKRGWSIIQPQ